MEAQKAGADDAFLIEEGMITEATSSNVHLVTQEGTLVTRPLSNALLHGITRGSLLDLARSAGFAVEERPFSLDEAKAAAEVFITSASSFVMPVISIDGDAVGSGVPGPAADRLREIYIADKLAAAI